MSLGDRPIIQTSCVGRSCDGSSTGRRILGRGPGFLSHLSLSESLSYQHGHLLTWALPYFGSGKLIRKINKQTNAGGEKKTLIGLFRHVSILDQIKGAKKLAPYLAQFGSDGGSLTSHTNGGGVKWGSRNSPRDHSSWACGPQQDLHT